MDTGSSSNPELSVSTAMPASFKLARTDANCSTGVITLKNLHINPTTLIQSFLSQTSIPGSAVVRIQCQYLHLWCIFVFTWILEDLGWTFRDGKQIQYKVFLNNYRFFKVHLSCILRQVGLVKDIVTPLDVICWFCLLESIIVNCKVPQRGTKLGVCCLLKVLSIKSSSEYLVLEPDFQTWVKFLGLLSIPKALIKSGTEHFPSLWEEIRLPPPQGLS